MSTTVGEQAATVCEQAMALHQQGRLHEACAGYQRALQMQPENVQALHLLGIVALQMNDPGRAAELFGRVVHLEPGNFMAYVNRGSAYAMLNQHEAAIACYDRAIAVDPESNASPFYNRAVSLQQLQRQEAALASYDRAIALESDLDANAYYGRGVALLELRRHDEAIGSFDRALALGTQFAAAAYASRGSALHARGQHSAAVASFDQALIREPRNAEVHNRRGATLHELTQYEAALASFDRALAIRPDLAAAHGNRGLALARLGRSADALASFARAIALAPEQAAAHHRNCGLLLCDLRRYPQAAAAFDRAAGLAPQDAETHHLLGLVRLTLRQFEAARASFDRALALQPEHAPTHNKRGLALANLGQPAAALASYDRALSIDSRYAEAHFNRGGLLAESGRLDEALESLARGCTLEAPSGPLFGQLLYARMTACDWRSLPDDVAELEARLEQGLPAGQPLGLLALADSPALQQRAARAWSHFIPPAEPLAPLTQYPRHERIRVGYFSADFHEHAVAQSVIEVLEMHDRARFQITAFSLGPPSQGAMRARLRAATEEFLDVAAASDAEVAMLARSREIDIAVDLSGHTQGGRPTIFALRAAPVQVNYLGFSATLGMDSIDYLIADRYLIPEEHNRYYTEKIACLPHSYFPGDSQRVVAEPLPREALGLPGAGFVFCCFCGSFKITPQIFDSWMRILRQVSGSVLWLAAANDTAMRNLKREATERGIDPQRLIFAARTPSLAQHLARYRCADLFLDTTPYNAHSTGNDALWAGLPVLTCPQQSFASRAAASQLHAVGLAELIRPTLAQYEETAVSLATDAPRLTSLRRKLADNRATTRLFDMRRYTRDIEKIYTIMYTRYQAGDPPLAIAL